MAAAVHLNEFVGRMLLALDRRDLQQRQYSQHVRFSHKYVITETCMHTRTHTLTHKNGSHAAGARQARYAAAAAHMF